MKIKKVLAMLLLGAVVLVGCGGGKENPQSGTEGEKTYKIALVANGPIADGGWNADCYKGLQQAESELGYEIAYSEKVQQADYVTAFREYADAGYDLIVAPGFEFSDAIKQINKDYPDTKFVILSLGFTDTNVAALNFDNVQAGFLAGALAGLQTKTNSVAFIGGTEIPPTLDAMKGMEQGLKHVNPNAKLVNSMTGSWDDVAKGKELATAQASTSNVDAIYAFAGAGNTGIIEGAKEKGIYVIVEPLDILDVAPETIIGSTLLSNQKLIFYAAQQVKEGTFEGTDVIGNLSNEIMGMGRYSTEVSQEAQEKMAEIIEELKAGKISLER